MNKKVCHAYGTPDRKRVIRSFGLHPYVQTHHVIPKQWAKHRVLNQYKYNVHASYNLMLMPNKAGEIHLNTVRIEHSSGHIPYNRYVKQRLDKVYSYKDFDELVRHLKYNMKGNPDNIPWS